MSGTNTRLSPAERWFADRCWQVFDFQRTAWTAALDGESGLIHSPTGTGKSLAAWMGPLLAAPTTTADGKPLPIRVVWLTPMRALAADTAENLRRPVRDLNLPWTVGLRTGDTSASERAKQKRRLPSALVTTPESLSLLLSYADTVRQLRGVTHVIVDEWHELLGSKRGVQTELCLAALRQMNPELATWGLSATIGNLIEARDVLLGPGRDRNHPGRIISGNLSKTTSITALIPRQMERFPWAGHLGLNLLDDVLAAIERAESTLLFTNTRSQAELWFEAIQKARLDWLESLALHHGSLDRAHRATVEQLLRDGRLKCVVATSSLDLGVDFSPVDQVINIGSPKGVARLLQRAGRSGHRPGQASAVLCVPTMAPELIEIAAARRAANAGRVEARTPLVRCLDVLAQHLVTVTLGGVRDPESVRAAIARTHAYQDLTDIEWRWACDFVTRGGDALQNYPEFRLVDVTADGWKVTDRRIAHRHRMAVGTITSDAAVNVAWASGGRIGTIEESFISRLKPGDGFLFAGRKLELVRVRDMTAQVRRATGRTRLVPRWAGGKSPLSSQVAEHMQALMADAAAGCFEEPELAALRPLLAVQATWSALPTPGTCVCETTTSREGQHLFVYAFAGRLAHQGLAALVAWRLARETPATFSFSINDYGFELLTRTRRAYTIQALRAALSPDNLEADIDACLNASEMAKRQFRDIARVAGLVFQGYPGAGKSARQLQASSGLIFDVMTQYDPTNRLTAQARDEVLAAQLQISRIRTAVDRIADAEIVLHTTERLTPLAFALWAERLREQISTESWTDRVAAMRQRLERAAPDTPNG